MDNTEQISQDNQGHKKRALADDHLSAERLGDRHRPTDCETTEEQDLPNAETYHMRQTVFTYKNNNAPGNV